MEFAKVKNSSTTATTLKVYLNNVIPVNEIDTGVGNDMFQSVPTPGISLKTGEQLIYAWTSADLNSIGTVLAQVHKQR
jgi:hypothetical protein